MTRTVTSPFAEMESGQLIIYCIESVPTGASEDSFVVAMASDGTLEFDVFSNVGRNEQSATRTYHPNLSMIA